MSSPLNSLAAPVAAAVPLTSAVPAADSCSGWAKVAQFFKSVWGGVCTGCAAVKNFVMQNPVGVLIGVTATAVGIGLGCLFYSIYSKGEA